MALAALQQYRREAALSGQQRALALCQEHEQCARACRAEVDAMNQEAASWVDEGLSREALFAGLRMMAVGRAHAAEMELQAQESDAAAIDCADQAAEWQARLQCATKRVERVERRARMDRMSFARRSAEQMEMDNMETLSWHRTA